MDIETYHQAKAVSGGTPSPAQLRLVTREAAERDAQTKTAWLENQAVLARLSGRWCPLCRRYLGMLTYVSHVGTLLMCAEGHAWSNSQTAKDEIQ